MSSSGIRPIGVLECLGPLWLCPGIDLIVRLGPVERVQLDRLYVRVFGACMVYPGTDRVVLMRLLLATAVNSI